MDPDTSSRPAKRRHIGLWVLGTFVVAVIALVALWDWDWFLPLVEAQASSALGRKVTAQHLHVALGRTITVALDGVEVAGVPKAGLPPREPPKMLEDGAGVAVALLPDCCCDADALLKAKPLDGVALPKRGLAVLEVALLVAKMLLPDADVDGVLLPNRPPDDGALLALANVRPLLGV